MVPSDPTLRLPRGDELPDSDALPVDHELQTLISTLLRSILGLIWADRRDWFFGVNLGIYHPKALHPRVPIVPDAFLCLGVERVRGDRLRRSYVVWEENNISPIFALEVVSQTPGGEYDEKMTLYARLGVRYYVIYNPNHWRRDAREPFEVYRLESGGGGYQRQFGEPFWMEEVNLGIGRGVAMGEGLQREGLYWYDERGNRYSTPEEVATRERQQREALESRLAKYRERFGDLPDE